MGELEDFLRKAAERARARQQRPAGKARPAPPRQRRDTAGGGVREHVEEHLGKSKVAEHVERHLRSGEVTQHAASLGQAVASEEADMEAALEAKFGKRTQPFAHASPDENYGGMTATPPSGGADVDALLALFRSPAQLRLAILASEILRRPEERW